MELVPRFFDLPQSESFFLFGPRGTGKSTWLRSAVPDALWVDLLQPEVFRQFSARPERLAELLESRKQEEPRTIVIDEDQKLPEILGLVHSLIEEKKGRQFILTGSSARKLKRTGVDLLAGRAILRTFHPFMASELGAEFFLENALELGMVPLVLAAHRREEVLSTYIDLYINEEVKTEGLVRNIGNFTRFLEAISFSHGSVLNIANVSRDCQVGQKTVESYVSVLEDLLLAFRLEVFAKRARRQVSRHPKLYFFDCGVFRNIRPKGPMDKVSEIDGAALEGLVAQHLRAWSENKYPYPELFFWRTRSGNEVDFIVYGSHDFAAIEVKNAPQVRPQDLSGLLSFREDYPECLPILLYRGKERIKQKGILCIPVNDFLIDLRPGACITDVVC